MTGRMPSVHGLRYNGCTLPARANTFVDVLRVAGYRTATIGKSHLEPFTGIRRSHDDEDGDILIREAWREEDADRTNEDPFRYESDEYHQFPKPYYGFDHVDMVTDHGDRAGGHYRQWFRRTVPNWRDLVNPANQIAHNYSCPQAYRTPIPENLYPTAFVRDRACDYLRRAACSDRPFFAFVSFPDPHHPFNPPGKYWGMYDPDDFEHSDSTGGPFSGSASTFMVPGRVCRKQGTTDPRVCPCCDRPPHQGGNGAHRRNDHHDR